MYPAKTNLQDHARLCKNLARILHARLAWHVHAICPFSCTILAPILARSCKNVQEMQVIINSCKILHHFLRDTIVQESCKKRDMSRAHAKQVLHARFLQDSCMILQFCFCWVGGVQTLEWTGMDWNGMDNWNGQIPWVNWPDCAPFPPNSCVSFPQLPLITYAFSLMWGKGGHYKSPLLEVVGQAAKLTCFLFHWLAMPLGVL